MTRRSTCRSLFGALAVAVACAAAAAAVAVPASAEANVIVDSDTVPLSAGEDGKHAGDIFVINAQEEAVTLTPSVPGDGGCAVTPSPTSVAPGRRTKVTLTLDRGCEVDKGATVRVAFDGGAVPASVDVKAAPPAKSSRPDWGILVKALWLPLAAVVIVLLGVRKRVKDADPPVAPPIKWDTELRGLGTAWSFKDQWIGNVTIGTTAVVTLLTTSDVLKAVLGAKPEAALGLIAVASAMAAALVSMGPLVLKAVGKDTGVPTVLGTLFAGAVTLLAGLWLVAVVTSQVDRLISSEAVSAFVYAVGFLTGFCVVLYGVKGLSGFVIGGAKTPQTVEPPEVRAAWIIRDALRPDDKRKDTAPAPVFETRVKQAALL